MLTFSFCWILVQLHSRRVFYQTYCYHIVMKSCEAGVEKKISSKVKPRHKTARNKRIFFMCIQRQRMQTMCDVSMTTTSEIPCYLGNRWQAKGYTAGRVNHEASSFSFHITPKSRPLKSINISYCISMTAVSPVGHSLDDNTAYINQCF